MEKVPFNISATKQGARALIRITGTIGWDTNAELFRSQVDGLVAQGVEDVHIYINSPGGSCFDAAEIVNILSSAFKGKVTGEGGALVASAGTYIAAHCSDFEMPENGMYMIHKPWGCACGTASEIESYLKLMRSTEAQYYKVYEAKAADPAELRKQWDAGDWWMTAKEAEDNGFIASVKPAIPLDRQTSALISACGCPQDKTPFNNIITENDMDLTAMATALGLPATATEEQVRAAIAAGRQAQTDLETLRAANQERDRLARAQEIDTLLTAAVNDKRITADMRPKWEKALTADFATNSELLAALEPVVKPAVERPASGLGKGGAATFGGKTFEQLQDEDPEALATLMVEDPEAYDALYNDYLKRHKLDK